MSITTPVIEDSGFRSEGASFATASVTVPSGAIMFIHASVASASAAMSDSWGTPSGLGATWTKLGGSAYGTRRASAVWAGVGASGSGTVSLQYTGTNSANVITTGRTVVSVTGQDGTTPYDGVGTALTAGATTLNPTVTGSGDTGDATVAFLSMESNVDVTFDGGWNTELYDAGEANNIRRMTCIWDADADPTPAFAWSGTNSAWGLALRIKTAAGATVPEAVTDLAGTAGDTQVVLTWTAPDDGGAAITDYVVQFREA